MRRLLLSVVLTASLLMPAISAQADEPINESPSVPVETSSGSDERLPPPGMTGMTYGRT